MCKVFSTKAYSCSQKTPPIHRETNQNEDDSHPVGLHAIDQSWKPRKLGAEGEVQLPLHVVDVRVLHILGDTQGNSVAAGSR